MELVPRPLAPWHRLPRERRQPVEDCSFADQQLDQGRHGWDPTKIVGGYTLEGRKKSNGYELSYAAPFGVGATVDVSQQAWVNSIWTNIVGVPIASDHYYGNTLKMQAMLVLSNNYWLP